MVRVAQDYLAAALLHLPRAEQQTVTRWPSAVEQELCSGVPGHSIRQNISTSQIDTAPKDGQ